MWLVCSLRNYSSTMLKISRIQVQLILNRSNSFVFYVHDCTQKTVVLGSTFSSGLQRRNPRSLFLRSIFPFRSCRNTCDHCEYPGPTFSSESRNVRKCRITWLSSFLSQLRHLVATLDLHKTPPFRTITIHTTQSKDTAGIKMQPHRYFFFFFFVRTHNESKGASRLETFHNCSRVPGEAKWYLKRVFAPAILMPVIRDICIVVPFIPYSICSALLEETTDESKHAKQSSPKRAALHH